MSLVSMRQVLDEAPKGGYGVGAFSVNNMEQIRKVFAEHPEEFDPRTHLKPGARSDESSDRTTDDRIRQHASDYQPIPLAEMAKRYAGETVTV